MIWDILLMLLASASAGTGVALAIDKDDPNWGVAARAGSGVFFLGVSLICLWVVFRG